MKNHILPVLRHKLVADITVQDICEVLDPLWEPKSRSKQSRYSSENDVLIEKSVKYMDFCLLSIVYVW